MEENSMSQNDERRLLINLSASDYAFHAGQTFARLLVDRAFENVRIAGESVVTVQHVAAVMNLEFVEEVIRRLAETSDGRAHGKKTDEGDSPDCRKAA
jgi:hypothetical protein